MQLPMCELVIKDSLKLKSDDAKKVRLFATLSLKLPLNSSLQGLSGCSSYLLFRLIHTSYVVSAGGTSSQLHGAICRSYRIVPW